MAISVAPSDSLEFLPLFPEETEAAILERMEAWANEGLDPAVDVDQWVDTREGSHWSTAVTPCAREIARVYDRMGTEVPMSAMVIWAWGAYLDDLAQVWQIERLAATPAEGVVRFVGPVGTVIGAGTVVGVPPAGPDEDAPSFEVVVGGTIPGSSGEGELELQVRALEAGKEGNVAAGAITAPQTPLPGVAFANEAATEGGTDVETDEALAKRLLEQFAGKGGGTVRDYRVWAKERSGVGEVTVVPAWEGPNTVLVIVTDSTGNPTSAETVTLLQNELDPVAGKGSGKAPVGAAVTVQTAAVLNVTIDVTLDFEDGYSLDGFGGTIAREAQIKQAVETYIETVRSGDELVRSQVTGRIAVVPGVHDVGKVKINGSEANLAIPAAPPKVPKLTTFTPHEGTP
jgi:uncharacterized phage protein gp47/JayE